MKLRVGIIAKPLPTIEWLKNGKELVTTSTVSVESTTDSSAVLIKDASRLDTGSYEIKIRNVLGSASATIRIEILGISKFLSRIFTRPYICAVFMLLCYFCFLKCLYLSLDKPGPPAGIINFNSITAERIMFSWEPVPESDQGGSKVTHYIVERRETSRVVWSTVSDKCEQTFVTVSKLVRGNEYVFRVMGVNKYGAGEPLESEPVIAKNAFGRFPESEINPQQFVCYLCHN